MRLLAVPLLASMLFAPDAFFGRAPEVAAPAPQAAAPAPADPPAEEELAEPAPEALPPLPAVALRETGAPVPSDVKASVRAAKDGGWQVKLARKGQLVALRYGGARVAGDGEATLAVPADAADPVVWEATKLDTLATVRGTLRLEGEGARRAALRMVEAPIAAGSAEGKLHACAAHEDGAGGFTVLCRVRGPASAANVTGEEAGTDVWSVVRDGASFVRMDLPRSPSGFAASVVGYPSGTDGIVVRAEASRAAGEERPVLTMLAAERSQPQVPRKIVRYTCCYRSFEHFEKGL